MEKLERIEGKYYTQNVEDLPIEERTFFVEGTVYRKENFRIATEQEVAEWKEYERQQEEMNSYEG